MPIVVVVLPSAHLSLYEAAAIFPFVCHFFLVVLLIVFSYISNYRFSSWLFYFLFCQPGQAHVWLGSLAGTVPETLASEVRA